MHHFSRGRSLIYVSLAGALALAAWPGDTAHSAEGEALAFSAKAVTGLSGRTQGPGGTQLWAKRYEGQGHHDDNAAFVASTPNRKNVFVAGSSAGRSSGIDYATVAYDASTGATRWVARYNGGANGDDYATSLGVSPDGTTVFVTGYSAGARSGSDYATVAYDASNGATLWVKRYNGPGNGEDLANSLEVSKDGSKVFVTGVSDGSTSASDCATIAYAASNGATIWVERYEGSRRGSSHDGAISIGLSPDGALLFVTGFTASWSNLLDVLTIAYDSSTGAARWLKRYNAPGNGNDFAVSVGVSPDGHKVFVTGASQETSDNFKNYDYLTIAYDASTGFEAWVRRYNSPGDGHGQANSLQVSPNGTQVFVTGGSPGPGSRTDYATIAYDVSTGATQWLKRYNGPGNGEDVALSVGVNPEGATVFVTGKSLGSSSQDFATIAYKASTGSKLWVSRYDGPGGRADRAASVAVSPLGTEVFVTGESKGASGSFDYATIAYNGS